MGEQHKKDWQLNLPVFLSSIILLTCQIKPNCTWPVLADGQ
jgi:hypothetical protein